MELRRPDRLRERLRRPRPTTSPARRGRTRSRPAARPAARRSPPRARGRPSPASGCRAARRRTARRAAPTRAPPSGEPVSRWVRPHAARWAMRILRWVGLSSTMSARRPAMPPGTASSTGSTDAGAASASNTRWNVAPSPATPVLSAVSDAVHQLGEAAADRESQARAPVPARDRGIDLAERLEQPVEAVGRDADPGVAHVDRELPAAELARVIVEWTGRPRAMTTSPDSVNLTAFDRRLRTIWRSRPASPMNRSGSAGSTVAASARPLRPRPARGRSTAPSTHGGERERGRVELELAGLDLAEVEDVVDDREQGVARGADRLREVPLLVVERRAQEQPAHPDDRVHRRPDLVAHRGEERATSPGSPRRPRCGRAGAR